MSDNLPDEQTSGINLHELDASVRPQDDLFRHVNGKWIHRTEIPDDKARYGSFTVLAENAEEAVRDIITSTTAPAPGLIEGAEDTQTRKVAALFASFTNTERVNTLGADPIRPDINQAFTVNSTHELISLVGQLERQGLASFYGMFVDNDPGNPNRYITFLTQGGIGLPDESYYREEQFATIREKYRPHIARMLHLAGVANAEHVANLAYELERNIASTHWNKVASRDIHKTYNLRNFTQLQKLTPELNWNLYIEALGAPPNAFTEVVAQQPQALTGLAKLLVEDQLDSWRAWLAWSIVRNSAALLSQDISRANFDFYGTVLTGATQQRERWRRGVSFVEGAMGEAVGRLYVERHFDTTAKNAMDTLVNHLIEAYRESISQLEWMSESTRARAREKLNLFTPKIGYPTKWRDYSALSVDSGDLLGNAKRIAAYEQDRELSKVGQAIDRDEWFMTPQTVNAYYNPGFNEIVFPAAILQPPFFNKHADDAANFGAIGAVIGHEIGHGFDDQGSRYDGEGKLTDWWTQEDRTAFEERTRSLINQYNALSPEGADGHNVNGELTIGENIGDLGGLAIAWKAYLRSLGGTQPPIIDGLTGGERFFLSWAQAWQQKSRPEETVRLLTIDPHSPNEFRCNQIVANLDAFHETYSTSNGDALWLEPDQRVTIW